MNYCHPIHEKASSFLIQNYVHFAKQPNGGAFMRDIRYATGAEKPEWDNVGCQSK